jgi:hypothetical protein
MVIAKDRHILEFAMTIVILQLPNIQRHTTTRPSQVQCTSKVRCTCRTIAPASYSCAGA